VFTIETNVNRDTIITFITTHGYKWITKVAEDDVYEGINLCVRSTG